MTSASERIGLRRPGALALAHLALRLLLVCRPAHWTPCTLLARFARKKTAKPSRGSTKKNSRRVSYDDEDAASSTAPRAGAVAASPAFSYTGAATASNRHGQATSFTPYPPATAYQMPTAIPPAFSNTGATAASSGYHLHTPGYTPQPQASQHGVPSGFETGSDTDIFQLAYAQAYANLQAQHQAWAYQQAAAATPQQHPTGYGYGYGGGQQTGAGYQSAYAPQHVQPQMPSSLPMPPFAAMPGVSANAAEAGDDGLSNVLLAWYQSGYYTGRFQAMQEMKARERR